MACVNNHKSSNNCCPDFPEETLTFSNCTPVAGSDPSSNPNTILHVADGITAVVAFSLVNTGDNPILLTVASSDPTFSSTTVEVGSSFVGVFADVTEITIENTAGDPITGIFKYQITYTFDV